jgi:uracil-DNA glycosylase family 4
LASSDRQAQLARVHAQILCCEACGLCRAVTHYVPGEGPADAAIVFVGEAPGAEEDRQGRPFVGASGSLLTRLLAVAGLDRKDVFITSVIKCRPPGNREPTAAELAACRVHLKAQLEVIRPRVVCTLGRIAAQALIDRSLSISREHGRPRRIGEALYVPLYHPAAALHQQRLGATLEADMAGLREVLATELGRRR